MLNHPDRLFPADPATRRIARAIYEGIRDLPLISPHGHCDPAWFANNAPFPDPAALLITPDHYLLRMLHSQGVDLARLGVAPLNGGAYETDPRKIWALFAHHYHLFRATPSRLWLDHTFETLFDLHDPLTPDTATLYYDQIAERLSDATYRPRALFERFNIEILATTEGALDPLTHYAAIADSAWGGKVVTTYRPDAVTDPEYEGFRDNLSAFGALTGCDVTTWAGYLAAHRARRATFRAHGATATDHGFETPDTADLSAADAEALFHRVTSAPTPADAALFRAQMLTEFARMSVEDGMTMQIHAGSVRNHSARAFHRFGRDIGYDIPRPVDWVAGLRPLLNAVGHEPELTVIVFTLDETTLARELAPLAGTYPALKLGPAWWFYDSPDGMRRFRELTVETAGFYNSVGFNDDTRAFPSIPARHDVARRVDAAFLAERVADHRLREGEAHAIAHDLTITLPRKAYGYD